MARFIHRYVSECGGRFNEDTSLTCDAMTSAQSLESDATPIERRSVTCQETVYLWLFSILYTTFLHAVIFYKVVSTVRMQLLPCWPTVTPSHSSNNVKLENKTTCFAYPHPRV